MSIHFNKMSRFLISCGLLWSATLPAQTQFIPLTVDYGCFQANTGTVYTEYYISFLQNSLQHTATDSNLTARFSIELHVKDGDKDIYRNTRQLMSHVDDMEDLNIAKELHSVFPVELPAGNFTSSIRLVDHNSGMAGEYLLDTMLPETSETNLAMSDIELSAQISRDQSVSEFNKNGFRVIPNASGVYSITMPVLYYYAEVYNFKFSDTNPGTYKVESFITDKSGNEIRTFPVKTNKKPGDTAVLVGGNNIVTLPSNTYLLNIKVTDETSGKSVTKSKRFTLFKPTKEQIARSQQARASSSDLMLSHYRHQSEEQLDEEFAQAKYLCTSEEKDVFPSLNAEGKAEFMAEFWNSRDNDKSTPQNEYKINYFQLLEYANTNFTTKFKDGWKSDRGRVLLVYGAPNQIERSPSAQGSKPYEIWSYDQLEGGSIFVFADMQSFGDYELLHSTYSHELSQPDWERRILKRRSDDLLGN